MASLAFGVATLQQVGLPLRQDLARCSLRANLPGLQPDEAVAHVKENYAKHLERLQEKRAAREVLRPDVPPVGRQVAPE